jgi:hypothetical protein
MADSLARLSIKVDTESIAKIVDEHKQAIREAMGEDVALANTVKDAAKAYGEAVYEARACGLTVAIDLLPPEGQPLHRETAFAKTTVSREL